MAQARYNPTTLDPVEIETEFIYKLPAGTHYGDEDVEKHVTLKVTFNPARDKTLAHLSKLLRRKHPSLHNKDIKISFKALDKKEFTEVRKNNLKESLYSMRSGGFLKVEEAGPRTAQAVCTICKNSIYEQRYLCMECPGFIMCQRCETTDDHANHLVVRVPDNVIETSRLFQDSENTQIALETCHTTLADTFRIGTPMKNMTRAMDVVVQEFLKTSMESYEIHNCNVAVSITKKEMHPPRKHLSRVLKQEEVIEKQVETPNVVVEKPKVIENEEEVIQPEEEKVEQEERNENEIINNNNKFDEKETLKKEQVDKIEQVEEVQMSQENVENNCIESSNCVSESESESDSECETVYPGEKVQLANLGDLHEEGNIKLIQEVKMQLDKCALYKKTCNAMMRRIRVDLRKKVYATLKSRSPKGQENQIQKEIEELKRIEVESLQEELQQEENIQDKITEIMSVLIYPLDLETPKHKDEFEEEFDTESEEEDALDEEKVIKLFEKEGEKLIKEENEEINEEEEELIKENEEVIEEDEQLIEKEEVDVLKLRENNLQEVKVEEPEFEDVTHVQLQLDEEKIEEKEKEEEKEKDEDEEEEEEYQQEQEDIEHILQEINGEKPEFQDIIQIILQVDEEEEVKKEEVKVVDQKNEEENIEKDKSDENVENKEEEYDDEEEYEDEEEEECEDEEEEDQEEQEDVEHILQEIKGEEPEFQDIIQIILQVDEEEEVKKEEVKVEDQKNEEENIEKDKSDENVENKEDCAKIIATSFQNMKIDEKKQETDEEWVVLSDALDDSSAELVEELNEVGVVEMNEAALNNVEGCSVQ